MDARINKLEAERVARCSKLVPCRHDIKFSGTVNVAKHRLLDGMYEDLATTIGRTGDRHLIADLSKVKVSFSKIVVTGWNLKGNMELKVKCGDDFVAPDLAEVKEEKLSTTYLFKNEICPDALRLDFFGTETMELYELEAF